MTARRGVLDGDVLARLDAIERRLAVLEQPGASRDAADAALRRVLARSTGGRVFTSSDLLRHSHVDADLAAALEAADLTTTRDLGAWLRDRAGAEDGIVIARGRNRRWHVRHVTCADGFGGIL